MSFSHTFNKKTGHLRINDGSTEIPPLAFLRKPGVKKVTIPDSVATIGRAAFHGIQLTEIVIPDSVVSIGSYAFSRNLLQEVVIPDSVTFIGASSFWDNDLVEIEISDSASSIGNYAFADNELSAVDIPDSVVSIGDGSFYQNRLVEFNFPSSIASIGRKAFAGNFLYDFVVPDSVLSLGDGAFKGNLVNSVLLPDSFADNLPYEAFDPWVEIMFEGKIEPRPVDLFPNPDSGNVSGSESDSELTPESSSNSGVISGLNLTPGSGSGSESNGDSSLDSETNSGSGLSVIGQSGTNSSADSTSATSDVSDLTSLSEAAPGLIADPETGAAPGLIADPETEAASGGLNVETDLGIDFPENNVNPSEGDDVIFSIRGKGRLKGGGGADEFVFNIYDKFKRKKADRIIDFNPQEGDSLSLTHCAIPGLGESNSFSFGIAGQKRKELLRLSKRDYDLVYFEKKGRLYWDSNGASRKWGDSDVGGLVAIFRGKPELTADDIQLIV